MKNLTIASNLVTLSLGALLSACGAAESGTSSDQTEVETSVDPNAPLSLGEKTAALTACDDPQYDHWRYISSLAVAAGNELGRWNVTDFTMNNGVQLSASGLARCKSGCQNVQAILSLQNNGKGTIPRHDPALFKQYLVAYYNNQVNWNNANGVNDHVLVPTTITTASCGYRYWFRDTIAKLSGTTPMKSAMSSKCLDITGTGEGAQVVQRTCDGTDDQKIIVDPVLAGGYRLKVTSANKCMHVTGSGSTVYTKTCDMSNNQRFDLVDLGGGKYQLKNRLGGQCAEVANWSSADGAQIKAAGCGQYNTNQQFNATVGTTQFDNPNQAAMKETLRFVGSDVNPYIQFQFNAQEVSVDPMGTMVDGGSSGQTGSCIEASSAFDSTRQVAGKCCTYSAKYGNFQGTSWNANLFYCK